MYILTFILKIIIIILEGENSIYATKKVSKETGMDFSVLWSNLPSRYK